MKSFSNFLNKIPIHPFLLGLYPVLFLWFNNIDQTPFYAIFRSLFFSMGLVCIGLVLSRLIFRHPLKAAIFTSVFLTLFFTFGHIIGLFDGAKVLGITIGKLRYYTILQYFTVFWFILLLIGMIVIWKSKSDFQVLNRIMNLVSTFLVAIIFIQVMLFEITIQKGIIGEIINSPSKTQAMRANSNLGDRDVYYIILDSYGRQDALQDGFGLDNSTFIRELTNLGFIIPDCTLSNYDATELSMTASLNMNYIDNLGIRVPPDAEEINARVFYSFLQKSLVRLKFEEMGYQTVAFKTIYPFVDLSDADYYFDVEETTGQLEKLESLNFQYLFFRTTGIRLVIDLQKYSPQLFEKIPPAIMVFINPKAKLFSSRYLKQYDQNLYALESLEEISDIPGKKFIYAHLFIAHQPFVFTPDGKFRWPNLENDAAYRDQVLYANKRMIEIIKTILSKSKTPPIIIIQGDHSYTWTQDRNKILNAYYLPEGGIANLYATISPVNTFRLIFNYYFDGDYELLPDVAYYSRRERPYDFKVLSPSCVGNGGTIGE